MGSNSPSGNTIIVPYPVLVQVKWFDSASNDDPPLLFIALSDFYYFYTSFLVCYYGENKILMPYALYSLTRPGPTQGIGFQILIEPPKCSERKGSTPDP